MVLSATGSHVTGHSLTMSLISNPHLKLNEVSEALYRLHRDLPLYPPSAKLSVSGVLRTHECDGRLLIDQDRNRQ